MISVDTVYQKVLAFANKEQRGYITPQEFNLFADQAQVEIFEQYFYDIDQYRRRPNNDHAYGDILTNLEDKVSYFKRYDENVSSRLDSDGNVYFDNDVVYRIGMVKVRNQANKHTYVAEEMRAEEEFELYQTSPLHGGPGSISAYSKERPVYYKTKSNSNNTGGEGISIRIHPAPKVSATYNPVTDGEVTLSYIKHPNKPNWGYVVVNDKPLYNANSSTNFELHASEESELVYRILTFAVIAIEKPGLTQMAGGLGGAQIQQEKQ